MTRADEILFDPQQISRLAIEQIKLEQASGKSMKMGIPQLDDHFSMMRPGKFIGILADTSQGKSSFLTAIARNMIENFENDGDIGVYVTWEDSVEDFGITDIAAISGIPISSVYNGDIGKAEFDKLMKAAMERALRPLWVVGHSQQNRTSRPRLTMTDVVLALENILHKQERRVRFVMFDYLQLVNLADVRGKDTRLRYAEAINQMKDVALGYGLTSICATQVKREVANRKWAMPQIHDAMETSSFEHACDGMIAMWYVHKSMEIGDIVHEPPIGEGDIIYCTKDLMLFETLKQKRGDARVLRALDFVPEYNMFVPYGKGDEYRRQYAI